MVGLGCRLGLVGGALGRGCRGLGILEGRLG